MKNEKQRNNNQKNPKQKNKIIMVIKFLKDDFFKYFKYISLLLFP